MGDGGVEVCLNGPGETERKSCDAGRGLLFSIRTRH